MGGVVDIASHFLKGGAERGGHIMAVEQSLSLEVNQLHHVPIQYWGKLPHQRVVVWAGGGEQKGAK